MAILLAAASGNLTAAGTWKVADATPATYLLGTVASTLTTTPGTGTDSNAWTGDASAVDGILLRLAIGGGSPSGTMTVILRRVDGAPVDVATVTINVADLPTSRNGYVLFKFGAPVTLNAAGSYVVRAYTSVASMVALLRDPAAATNWNRVLRTTTTQAPVAGDRMFVAGEKTAAGTQTALTVTADSTASTDYGAIDVAAGGTLSAGVAASTTYILRTSGALNVWAGGTLNLGTTGTPMPGTSKFTLEFDCTVDGEFGLVVQDGGTFVGQGAAKTNDRALLAADAAVAATSITTEISTGWAVGDMIAIAATARPTSTIGQSESRAITSIAGTSIGVAALSFAHDGTSPTQARIINLSRNVKIKAVSAALPTYVNLKPLATADLDWIELNGIGDAVTGKRGLEVETTTGDANVNRCSFWDGEDNGLYFGDGTSWGNLTFSDNVVFDLGKLTGPMVQVRQSNNTTISLTGNVFMKAANAYPLNNVVLYDLGLTFNSNEIIGGYWGLILQESTGAPAPMTGLTIACTWSIGLVFWATMRNNALTTVSIWRCAQPGIIFSYVHSGITFDGLTAFGNGRAHISMASSGSPACAKLTIKNSVLAGDASSPTNAGIQFSDGISAICADWLFVNTTFGVAAGSGGNARVAHAVADIQCQSANSESFATCTLINCALASSAEVANSQTLADGSYIRAQRLDQTNQKHKSWFRNGTVEIETAAIGGRTPPHEKVTGNHASNKIESGAMTFAVSSGQTVAPKVWARKTTTYNGPAPRLVRRKNEAAFGSGDTDQVAATMTAGVDTWEQLVGAACPVAADDAVVEYLVDGGGTAGSFYVDDWSE